jgi:glucose-6-phosphate isomerase
MVVIGTDDSALGPAVACRPFLTALQRACGGDASKVAQLVVPVARAGGRMFTLGQSLGCREIFCLPDGLDEGFSVLSAVGLLPAALLGLNVVTLLEGAQAMTTHFREARLGENAVLDYVAVCHLTEQKRGATTRVLNVWSKALESFGQWYGHLLAGSLRPYRGGATPITLSTNLIVERWRCDPLSVGNIGFDLDKRDLIADRTLPEIMAAAIQAANAANRADRLLTADLRLPQLNEFALGQLFQMLMLATLMEDWKTA